MLTDTVDRFQIDQTLQDFIDQMNSDDPAIYRRADTQSQLHLLANLDLWPKAKTLRFLDTDGRTVWELPGEKNASVVQIHEAQLKQGDVLKTLLEALEEAQRKTLLGEAFGDPVTSLENRALKLRKKLAGLAQSHRAELFNTRYEKLESPITPRQQVMLDNTPGLPLSAADALLDTANSQELKAVDKGTVPARLTELAQSLRNEARVNHAYDGLYLDSTANFDTHRLALHSLEQLPGWAGKKVRIEIRSPGPDSTLLDVIGKPKARIKRTLVRSPDGRYTPQDNSGELSGATDLYSAVLHALPDAERNALGLHIGQGPALRLALRTHALKRAPLRTLISAQPARAPTDTRTHLRLLGMDNYPPAPAEQANVQALARELYPAHTDEQIGEMTQALERRPGGAFATLTALRQEYLQLNRDLADWATRTPRRYPGTEVNMDRQEYSDMRQNRVLFWRELLSAWRQETETDAYFEGPSQNGHKLKSHAILFGDLPALQANFEHISFLELEGNLNALNLDGFLRSFPKLRHLNISNARLGQLPPAVRTMPQLNALFLSDCGITLTPESLNILTAMNRLRTLDLYKNPLGLTPNVERMVDLRFLDLSDTGISTVPAGLLSRASLELATLSRNQITQLPSALFDLPADTATTFDLSANPLSRATLEQVKRYYQRTGRYWDVDALAIDIQRVNTLFPDFSVNEVNRFLFGLPGNIEVGQIELARLEVEYADLCDGLDTWARQATTAEEQAQREDFKEELQAGWRREGALDVSSPQVMPTFTLESPHPVTGTFPSLDSGVFRHVSSLRLKGAQGPFPLQSSLFFRGFPTLNHLVIEGYVMGDIPGSVWDLPQLSSLRLPGCAITLSTESAASLSTLSELRTLDMSHNPLGQLPDFSALPKLSSIDLEATGLTAIPDSLLTAVERQRVNLSNNLITQLPDKTFRLPDAVTAVFDLSRNPLNRSALMQIKRHCQRTGEHWRVDAPAALRDRIKALYPTFAENEANRFFFELPAELDAAEPAIEQLEVEYAQLRADLEDWVVNVPERHPIVDAPLDEQTRAQDRLNRQAFKALLEEAWRREIELDDNHDSFGPNHKLTFETPILGELPELSARFDHVTTLDLEGNGTTTRIDGLLKCFPKLTSLVITRFSLGDIPLTAFSLTELNALSLTESAIRLTPTSVDALSGMRNLQYLDLGGNRLGLTPDVSHLDELEILYLPDTAITEIPRGLFALRELRSLDLSDNLIEEIPTDFLQLATQLDTASDLSGNPLSASSLDTLRQYYVQTGDDLAVAAASLDAHGNPLVRPDSPEPMEE